MTDRIIRKQTSKAGGVTLEEIQQKLDEKANIEHAHDYQRHILTQHDARAIQASVDWNNYIETGFYMGSNLLNAPQGIAGTHSWWYVIIIRHNASYAIQMATDFNNVATCYRVWYSGTWREWTRIPRMNDDVIFGNISTDKLQVFNPPTNRFRVVKEVKSFASSNSSITGTFKISLPVLVAGTSQNTFVGMKVRMWEYRGRGQHYAYIDGYMTESSGTKIWSNQTAFYDAFNGVAKVKQIRFGVENNRHVILISKDTAWSYPIIGIEQIQLGWLGANTDIFDNPDNYDISLITDEEGITINHTYNF